MTRSIVLLFVQRSLLKKNDMNSSEVSNQDDGEIESSLNLKVNEVKESIRMHF